MTQNFLVLLFWFVGPLAYCIGAILFYLVPLLDWHIIRLIPIPEFQHRVNILVPQNLQAANRYAVISFSLTIAFINQTVFAFLLFKKQSKLDSQQNPVSALLKTIKELIVSGLLGSGFCYLVFFWPQLIGESDTGIGAIYNQTDLKFFMYWGISIFVSLWVGKVVAFFRTMSQYVIGSVSQKR